MKTWREPLFAALALTLFSWLWVRAGIYAGELWVPHGAGYPRSGDVSADLFRFDSVYYKSIAESGYAYNGDPSSSPNLVFAPMYPLLVRGLALLPGLDTLSAGFLLNKLLLFGALLFLYRVLIVWLPRRRVIFALAALVTAAGSYAFHAFYSESTMLFFLSLCLYAAQSRRWPLLAFSAAALGASRLTALPVVAVFALLITREAWRERGRQRAVLGGLALLCLSGAAAYLAFIGAEFGNPFTLIEEIQKQSWGRFHQDADAVSLLTGGYLLDYLQTAAEKGWDTFTDIQTLNLGWMLAGLFAAVYLLWSWRRHLLTYVFVPYFVFIYCNNTSSEFLISAHRFFTLMVPLFLLATAGPVWLSALFLGVNMAYGLLHTAAFNQGVWFWF